jgi:adenylate kinase family enzyme
MNDRKLIVYPRDSGETQKQSKIMIPAVLKKCVEIAEYKDAVVCSSTLIRDQLKEGVPFTEINQYINEDVYQYITKSQLYKRVKFGRKIMVLMGPAGSGKGTLCSSLLKAYPKYTHISTGDLYREDQEKKTPEYLALEKEKKKGRTNYMDALNVYIIAKLKERVSPDKCYIIDGLKPTDLYSFETHIAKIDSVVVLNCGYKIAEYRIKKRRQIENRIDDTDESIRKRLGTYYRFLWIQKEILNSYKGTGRRVVEFNCEKPVNVLCKDSIWNQLLEK